MPYGSCRGLYVFYASRGVLSRPNDPRAPVHGLRLTAEHLDASDELREIRDIAKSGINPCYHLAVLRFILSPAVED